MSSLSMYVREGSENALFATFYLRVVAEFFFLLKRGNYSAVDNRQKRIHIRKRSLANYYAEGPFFKFLYVYVARSPYTEQMSSIRYTILLQKKESPL